MSADAGKRDSVFVTLLCGLGIALGLLALLGHYIPLIGPRLGLIVSALAFLLGVVGAALALGLRTRLVLPALTLVFSAIPAARDNLNTMRTVWVESSQICRAPGLRSLSVVGILGSMALAHDHEKAVGNAVCAQLGKTFADHECNGPIGRIKCEP